MRSREEGVDLSKLCCEPGTVPCHLRLQLRPHLCHASVR